MSYRSLNKAYEFGISRFLVLLFAIAGGVTVANLYYSQPLLEELSRFFVVSPTMIGITAMLIQIGYAFGLFFIVPLGDIKERRALIITVLVCSVISLFGISYASNIGWLLLGSLLIGLTSIVPMLIIALAAHLAKPAARGRVIGFVMSGLLIGIILSRAFSGIIGSIWGWQTVYRIAAGLIVLLIPCFYHWLPKVHPESNIGYRDSIRSLGKILREQPILQEASMVGAMMFATFSAFWTTLSFFLKSPAYNLGAKTAGLFGLIGIAGAVAASIVGAITDKKGPQLTLPIAIGLSFISFIWFWIFGYWMAGLIGGVILLEIGIQGAQVSNQARIMSLDATARNRINAVYMVFYFSGGALGSLMGSLCWGRFGWAGVCAVGILFQSIGAIIHLIGRKTQIRAKGPRKNIFTFYPSWLQAIFARSFKAKSSK